MGHEIVIEVEASFRIPKIFLNSLLPFRGFLPPLFGFFWAAEQSGHAFQILFGFVEQTIQADGSVMMGFGTERTKTKGNVKARFAHAAIAFVKIGRECDLVYWRTVCRRRFFLSVVRRLIAAVNGEKRTDERSRGMIF